MRNGEELGAFNLEVCDGVSHREFTVAIFNGKHIMVFEGCDPENMNNLRVNVEDNDHTAVFPIRYITFSSGPNSDAYWLIATVDEPKTHRFPYKPHDDD